MLWMARLPSPPSCSEEVVEARLLDLDGVTFSWEEVGGEEFLVLYASQPMDVALEGFPKPMWEEMPPGWETRYREYFMGFPWGSRLFIHPPWEKGNPSRINVMINPGRGFGTGTHSTTRLCLSFLEEVVRRERPEVVLDVGTGSGILAIAAVKLGVPRAVAIDIDQEALKNARENLVLNGVQERVVLVTGDPRALKGRFPLVLANLHFYAFLKVSKDLARLTSPGGHLIISGFLAKDGPVMADEMSSVGFREVEGESLMGWGGSLFVRG